MVRVPPNRRRQLALLVLTGLGTLGIVALSSAVLGREYLHSYESVERTDAHRDAARAAAALDQTHDRLAGIAKDWANWTDDYNYLLGTNPTFIEDNLDAGHMDSMGLDLMLFADRAGQVRHAAGYDVDRHRPRTVSDAELNVLAAVPYILRPRPDGKDQLTLVSLPEGPMMVASLPVRTTEGKGDPAGVIVFGARLGTTVSGRLSEVLQLPVQVFSPADPGVALPLGGGPEEPRIDILSPTVLRVQAPVHSDDGEVTAVVQLTVPRTIYQEGLAAEKTLLVTVGTASGVTLLSFAVFVELFLQARGARTRIERMHRAFADHAGEAILFADMRTLRVIEANRAATALAGGEAIGGPLAAALRMDPDTLDAGVEALQRNGLDWPLEYTVRSAGQADVEVEASLTRVTLDGDDLLCVVARDVTERRRMEARDRHLANHDALTGLPNRGRFQEALDAAIQAALTAGRTLGVAFLDLDGFKEVNDTLGHDVADRILIEVAERLQRCVRPGDIVARLGGDEFLVLLAELPTDADATRIAERLLDVLRMPFLLERQEITLTSSIGLARFPKDGSDSTELIKHADMAMYVAKEAGRDGWQAFDASMHDRIHRVARLSARLAHALERGEFQVHYQPQVDVHTGRMIGVEALVRWHSVEGPISPAEFIPIAEQSGVIQAIGEWVLRTAMRDALRWKEEGLGDVRVAVNLSARQFRDDMVVGVVRRALQQIPLPPALLELEITESVAMRNPDQARRVIEELVAMGVTFALDDFGTGYSSLAYLRQFPIQRLKIDRSFVVAASNNVRHRAMVAAIVDLAHAVELEVIAEGVETPEQADFLIEAGCEVLQGYGLSRPVPEAQLRLLLKADRPLLRPTPKPDPAVALVAAG